MSSRQIFRRQSIRFQHLLAGSLLILLAAVNAVSQNPAPQGFLEGHLQIYSPNTVKLADGNPPPVTAETYAHYPLVVLTPDSKKEVAQFTAGAAGEYRIALPPGAYLLDVQNRVRKHVRAKPVPFTVVANQTVQVNMEMDTGIR